MKGKHKLPAVPGGVEGWAGETMPKASLFPNGSRSLLRKRHLNSFISGDQFMDHARDATVLSLHTALSTRGGSSAEEDGCR